MTFEEAISSLKQGKKIMRDGWIGKDWEGKELKSFIEGKICLQICYPTGNCEPWKIKQSDVFADDWSIVD